MSRRPTVRQRPQQAVWLTRSATSLSASVSQVVPASGAVSGVERVLRGHSILNVDVDSDAFMVCATRL